MKPKQGLRAQDSGPQAGGLVENLHVGNNPNKDKADCRINARILIAIS